MLAMLAGAFTHTLAILLIATVGVIVSPFWDTVLERFKKHALQSGFVVLGTTTHSGIGGLIPIERLHVHNLTGSPS